MEILFKLLGVAAAAALTENLLFARAVGWGELDFDAFSRRRVAATLAAVTGLSTAAAFSAWLGKFLIESVYPLAAHLRPPVYLLVYAVLLFLFLLMWAKVPALQQKPLFLHPLLAFGFIPMAVMLIVGMGTYSLPESLVYGLFSGVGYLGAMVLSRSMRSCIELRKIPEAMRGAPIALLYFGLVSLALFGALGHQLAL